MLNMIKKRNNKKGFTLAELLIVVAIIAVLVAISIPIFTNQLEKAREATDASNIRAAYAEVSADALTEGGTVTSKYVTATQTKDKWQSADAGENDNMKIGGQNVGSASTSTGGTNKGWTISYDSTNSKVTITPAASKPQGAEDYPSNN